MSMYRTINPQLFDVSLRDGIQGESPEKYTTPHKKEILKTILQTQFPPQKIEIGSLVSPKILPIMRDSVELLEHAKRDYENRGLVDYYILVPNFTKLKEALSIGVRNVSLITSVSEQFQLTNVKQTLVQTKNMLWQMKDFIQLYYPSTRVKLYISCIDYCPISGRQSIEHIGEELNYYSLYGFDELCISDTCGKLTSGRFGELIDEIYIRELPISKLSLHLHVANNNDEDVCEILQISLRNGIHRFDVSVLESGGCSVTMDQSKRMPNLSYNLLYDALAKYIDAEISYMESLS